MNISQAVIYGGNLLTQSESPEYDSQCLLCHVLDCATIYIHSRADQPLSPCQQDEFVALLQQRQQGKPIAYLIGRRGFWTLDLLVTTDTLIPRPDTELLVELALSKLKPNMRVADLGTGSGAIALSLAQEQPLSHILAMDYSWPALGIAKENATRNQLNNVSFWRGQWLEAVANNTLDMVISNPPYIEVGDPHLQQGDVQFEPVSALTSGGDGLDDIRALVQQVQRCLKPSGWFLVEHGHDQAQRVQDLFRRAGFNNITSHKDLGDNDRVVMGQIT